MEKKKKKKKGASSNIDVSNDGGDKPMWSRGRS
jgi:hypothetical protein